MAPIVSVIITTFNGSSRGYLSEAIESVINQSFKDFELIIVDDGSIDGTKDICMKYLDNSKVAYLHQENKGLGNARNTGIINSYGAYICFLDDDDIWMPEKLEKQLAFFTNHTDGRIGMVFTSLLLIDEKGNPIGFQAHQANGDIYNKLFFENLVDGPSSVMIKRIVLDKVGIFREDIVGDEDNELWVRIAKRFHIYSLNEKLVKYRVHQKIKMSNQHGLMESSQIKTFYHILNDAPDEIRLKEPFIMYSLYRRFAEKHFGVKNYAEFRKNLRIAAAYSYKHISFLTILRYICSFFPSSLRIFRFPIKFKSYLKHSNNF